MSTHLAPLALPTAKGQISIGYRSPQLSEELDPAGKMRLAQELGMAVIEPQCNKREITSVQAAELLGRAAAEHGIGIPSFGCDIPLLTDDQAACEERIAFGIAVAQALGAGHLFTRVLLQPEDLAQADAWRQLADRLPPLLDRIHAAGLKLGIEADGGTFITSGERLLRLLELVDHPALVANFDACNVYLGGSDPVALVPQLAGRVINGHIKDGIWHKARHSEVAVGTGELDWIAILAAMREADMAVPMFIEHCKSSDQVRAAAEHLRDCLAELS